MRAVCGVSVCDDRQQGAQCGWIGASELESSGRGGQGAHEKLDHWSLVGHSKILVLQLSTVLSRGVK